MSNPCHGVHDQEASNVEAAFYALMTTLVVCGARADDP
jgi:hypothetical protein